MANHQRFGVKFLENGGEQRAADEVLTNRGSLKKNSS
jgi:hypothetical protein